MSLYQFTIIGTFTIVPESVVQAEGLNATFTCFHPNASASGWRLNSTSVNMRHPPDVITGTTNEGIHFLTILATPDYNGTTVQCFAFVMNGEGFIAENATTVLLLVQGILKFEIIHKFLSDMLVQCSFTPLNVVHSMFYTDALSAVSSIARVPDTTNIIIRWKPPFSLNLTHAEPDVVYCIDVYNVTNWSYDHLISDCSIKKTQYLLNVSLPDPRDIFEFIITPRSNIAGAKNGTPSEPMEAYFYGNCSKLFHCCTIYIQCF